MGRRGCESRGVHFPNEANLDAPIIESFPDLASVEIEKKKMVSVVIRMCS